MILTLDSIRDIRLYQRRSGYRFSLDALLLFDFAQKRIQKAQTIADLGAGSGVVGLLLAKRYPAARVVLLELQDGLYGLSLKNIALNGLEGRVRAVKTDLMEIGKKPAAGSDAGLGPGSFDMAVANPPFRKVKSGRLSLDEERAVARHELTLPLAALAKAASYLVKNRGRFFMIHHPGRLPEIFTALQAAGFEPKRLRFVHGRPAPDAGDVPAKGSGGADSGDEREYGLSEIGPSGTGSSGATGAKMVLVEAVRAGSPGLSVERPFFVYGPDGAFGAEVRRIYGL